MRLVLFDPIRMARNTRRCDSVDHPPPLPESSQFTVAPGAGLLITLHWDEVLRCDSGSESTGGVGCFVGIVPLLPGRRTKLWSFS